MDNHNHNKRWLILLLLLALLCIGSAELIACYHFAPDTFHTITAPVRTTAERITDSSHYILSELSAWWADITVPKDVIADEESQEASTPALENTAPILDPAVTELITDGDTSTLTGGIIPVIYFNQADETWADQPYGSDDIGRYGCGPTAMAMAVYSFTGEVIDPVQMAEQAVAAGHWAKRGGSYLSIVNGLAEEFGLSAESVTEKTPEAIKEALLSGKLLVALMGPGHFTKGGHFILIRGITLNGTLLVADPNSTERSLQEWDAQLILDELSTSTSNGGPLWVLSCPDT